MKVTEIPVTPHIVKLVEKMACKEGFKSLKFCNQHKVELHPADWIAGVDCKGEEDNNKNDPCDDEEDEDEECDKHATDLDEEEEEIEDNINDEDKCNQVDPAEVDALLSDREVNEDANLMGNNDNDDDNEPADANAEEAEPP